MTKCIHCGKDVEAFHHVENRTVCDTCIHIYVNPVKDTKTLTESEELDAGDRP